MTDLKAVSKADEECHPEAKRARFLEEGSEAEEWSGFSSLGKIRVLTIQLY